MDFLNSFFGNSSKSWEHFVVFVVVFAVAAAALFFVRSLALRLFVRWTAKTETTFDDIFMESIKHPSIFWVFAVALYIALGTSEFPAKYVEYGLKALHVVITFSITLAVASFLSRAVQSSIEKYAVDLPVTGLSKTIIYVVVFAIGFLIILTGLGISITPFITAIGVGGLAIALALQDTLSNLFAGMHILVERSLKVGDYIKFEAGHEGYVADIGWRTTKIRKLSNDIIVIPNNKVTQSIITNYCMPDKSVASQIQLGLGYDCDTDAVEKTLVDEMEKAVGHVTGLLAEPAPAVKFLSGFGPSSIELTIAFRVAEFADQFTVKDELTRRILKRLKTEGITLPYPTTTVYLKKE